MPNTWQATLNPDLPCSQLLLLRCCSNQVDSVQALEGPAGGLLGCQERPCEGGGHHQHNVVVRDIGLQQVQHLQKGATPVNIFMSGAGWGLILLHTAEEHSFTAAC